MVLEGTPVEFNANLGLWVKREDLCCPGGPNFSKTRGVYAHVAARNEPLMGVLDTAHSQGGWAVARACSELGKGCVLYYPIRKADDPNLIKPQQQAAKDLGADLVPMQAGRSAVLYHQARARLSPAGYMMPNALKLIESVQETAAEVERTEMPPVDVILISASSGTITSGVLLGLRRRQWQGKITVHMGYSRPENAVRRYIEKMIGGLTANVEIVDEGYTYADSAKPGIDPGFPCNEFYDLKAIRWWAASGRNEPTLFWNIG